MNADLELDVKGLNCPLPILKIKKVLTQMQSGQCVRVLATDAGSQSDIPAFTKQTGHTLMEQSTKDDTFIFVIRKK